MKMILESSTSTWPLKTRFAKTTWQRNSSGACRLFPPHWTSLEKIDFQAPVVPVVLGGANYSAIAPNHSFIHVDDFARCLQILVGFPPKDLLWREEKFQPRAAGNLLESVDLRAGGVPQVLLVETSLSGLSSRKSVSRERLNWLSQVLADVDPVTSHLLPSTFPCNLCSHLHQAASSPPSMVTYQGCWFPVLTNTNIFAPRCRHWRRIGARLPRVKRPSPITAIGFLIRPYIATFPKPWNFRDREAWFPGRNQTASRLKEKGKELVVELQEIASWAQNQKTKLRG